VHFTSHGEWKEAASLGIPFRGVVIPLGVEAPQSGDREALSRTYGELEGRIALLFLSRIDPKKNVEALLKAVAAINRQRTKTILIIAGSGLPEYVMSLKKLSEELGIARQVVWLGHVEGPHKAAAFSVADAFVLPSLSENF